MASFVSYLNECVFCSESHAAVADVHWGEQGSAKKIWLNVNEASPRLQAFLRIAKQVQKSGRSVQTQDIELARRQGATDADIHDCVLIAAAFCLYNRYVDGLATLTPPQGDKSYAGIGQMLAEKGYVNSI